MTGGHTDLEPNYSKPTALTGLAHGHRPQMNFR